VSQWSLQYFLTSNVTSIHWGPKHKRMFVCRYMAPTWWVLLQHYYVAISFHCQVWYRTLSLHYARIRNSDIILITQATFVPNLVSFVASIAELAHGEKSRTQINKSPSFHRRVWYRALSLLHVYSKFGHCPHHLGYHCVKFHFFRGLRCWASPWRKITYSITQHI